MTPAGAAPGQVAVTDARSAASISGPESPPPEPELPLEPPLLELLLEPPLLDDPLLDDELLADDPLLEDELLVDDPPLLEELPLEVEEPPLEVEEPPLLLDDAPLEVEEPLLLDEPAPDDEELPLELLVDVPPPSGVDKVGTAFEVLQAGSSNPTPMAHNHGDQIRFPNTCVASLRCMRFSLKWSCGRNPRPPCSSHGTA